MTTMIIEDVAVVAVIALFVWLVPVRRNGIPGLRGRGRVPSRHVPASRVAADNAGSDRKAGRPERAPIRPIRRAEVINLADGSSPHWVPIDSRSHKHSA
jgi:hypothetical protein